MASSSSTRETRLPRARQHVQHLRRNPSRYCRVASDARTNSATLKTNINTLPDSVLNEIFKNCDVRTLFYSARRVCRRWYNICADKDIWRNKHVDISLFPRQHRKPLFAYGPVADVHLHSRDDFSSSFDEVLESLQQCRDVKRLKLCNVGPEPRIMQAVTERCSKLERLELNSQKHQEIAPQHLLALCQLPRLKELSFSHIWQFNNETVAKICRSCLMLESIKLHANCYSCSLTTEMLSALGSLPRLTRLQLACMSNITDETLVTTVERLPRLTAFSIRSCEAVTQAGLFYITKLENLKDLHIHQRGAVLPAAFIHQLSQTCRRLQKVQLCSDLEKANSLLLLCKELSDLRSLSVVSHSEEGTQYIDSPSLHDLTYHVRGKGGVGLISVLSMLPRLPALKYLLIKLSKDEDYTLIKRHYRHIKIELLEEHDP